MGATLSDGDRAKIQALIFAGRKIQAIKLYRGATGQGLKEAKDAVDAMTAELRASDPEKFSASSSKSGCMTMIAMLVAPLAAAAAFRWL
ncbi:MAG TPA: ribosomal protein L7/L12 [Tepidisphaeraceae bacterium]|jgi:ribosomal protein L7/L12|nr:ribosomal protein L7/L12 [Tepidisphaeraceae bacterium]